MLLLPERNHPDASKTPENAIARWAAFGVEYATI
jgi:hypothetical protein